MRLKYYLNENIDPKRWNEYLNKTPMLKSSIKVLKQIEKNGYNAYIVGGTVRDIILGNKIKDIDISTNMPMDDIYKTFKRVYDIGKSKDFGIIYLS